jgi:hypothetical protein
MSPIQMAQLMDGTGLARRITAETATRAMDLTAHERRTLPGDGVGGRRPRVGHVRA